jgi:hypothetical protein
MELQLEHAIEILSRTPDTLNRLLRDLPDPWLFNNEGADTWSAFDIVGHLIHGEVTDWIPRARIILEHGESRTFEPFDRFAQRELSKGKTPAELLDEFASLRKTNIASLKELNITPDKLKLRGTHPELGAVTLSELLSTWVVHDLGHVAQTARVMSRQYTNAVGPWRAYLPILVR